MIGHLNVLSVTYSTQETAKLPERRWALSALFGRTKRLHTSNALNGTVLPSAFRKDTTLKMS
jgi:hypothetical protein